MSKAIAALALLTMPVVGCGRNEDLPPPATVAEEDRLQSAARVARIEPGTRIGDGPPAGWSHLVLKTRPRLTSGDVDKLLSSVREAIPKYHNSVVLNVERDRGPSGRYRIAAFAVGLGTPAGGEDVIVTEDAAEKLGLRLGIMEGTVLSKREDELDAFVCPAKTETMAIVDFPATVRRGEKHVGVVMRFASLVDPDDGRLTTLHWMLDPAGRGYQFSGDSLVVLDPNQVMDWNLHVDGGKFLFGTPTAEAFAATSVPQGTPLVASAELKQAAAEKFFSVNSRARLEQMLRTALTPDESQP
jgi:hypothetical protein